MSKRAYRDRCGVARALDLVGDRWALLVVRELLLWPKRFSDLRAGLPHIGPDVLAYRLRDLQEQGVIEPADAPPPTSAQVYRLTARGLALEPVILALGRWGSDVPFADHMDAFGPSSAVLALKTLFDPASAAATTITAELRFNAERFTITIEDGALYARSGEATDPDVVFDTDPGTFAAFAWHGLDLNVAIGSGRLRLLGERGSAHRFLEVFPLQ
jgi:DNA-binding HxlR family transcriptional regulator